MLYYYRYTRTAQTSQYYNIQQRTSSAHSIYFICLLLHPISEPVETERLHRHAGTHREHGQRFLAHDMARKRVLHRHVDQDFRLYQGLCVYSPSDSGFRLFIRSGSLTRLFLALGYVHTVLAVGQGEQRKLRRSQYISVARRRISQFSHQDHTSGQKTRNGECK